MRKSMTGYSLVELMVTIVILFVLGSFAIPAYIDYLDTNRRQAVMNKIEQFKIFESSHHVDNRTYVAGSYDPHGANTLRGPLGYRMENDSSDIRFTVSAGSCGDIADCYKVEATDGLVEGTWDSVTGTWTWAK